MRRSSTGSCAPRLDEAQRISSAKKAAEAEAAPRDGLRQDGEWTVLFCSRDPFAWNTDSNVVGEDHYAVVVTKASREIRFLRLRRKDTGDTVVIPISKERLATSSVKGRYGWDGTKTVGSGAPHLGIADTEKICQVSDGGRIMVSGALNAMGWGFGHKIHVNDRLYFSWACAEIEPTVFEIAVKARGLSTVEKALLLNQ